jgi:autotransporter adhesin
VATGANSAAFGAGAQATGAQAFAAGFNAKATGTNSIAIGNGAVATGSIAMGTNASAANAGVAFGDGTTATGSNSVALGVNANATLANSAAIGTGATVTRANQQVFGTASNTYTTAGITSAASLAAQTGPVQIVTSDAGGNLATNTPAGLGLATTAQIATINGQLAGLSNQIIGLSNQIGDVRRGIAATAATAYVATPSAPGRTTFAVNGGLYNDVGGVGFAFAHRFANTSIPVYFSGAYGNGGGREHVGRVGFAWEW